ncbi:uncharacterized protein LOC115878052 [Sitophilus oryzae]|uniref:Uncharacterized protein LOC115878052 n=1 Tax=Sitophilus oryzae TaxID=7048 RepID=A0A6J2XG69_SITOR|nr:uncharacterized protein LOC115878052 [Sitophilus oryzae]
MFDTDKFIQCVQEYSAIWEKASKEYSDRNEKEKSWRSVGEVMFDMWEAMAEAEKQEQVENSSARIQLTKRKWAQKIRMNFEGLISDKNKIVGCGSVSLYKIRTANQQSCCQLLNIGKEAKCTITYFSIAVKEMRNKWRHIRDSYSKYINQGVSGDPAPKKRKYVYADALSFLQQTIEKRSWLHQVAVVLCRTTGSMPRVSDEEGEGEGDGDSSQENPPDIDNVASQQTPQQYRPKPGKSARGRKTAPAMTPFQTQLLSSLGTAKSVEDDTDRAFLLSLLPDYRQLNAEEKLDFRLQSLQFFCNVRNKRSQPHMPQQPTTSYRQNINYNTNPISLPHTNLNNICMH